jgi:ubiquinone/menaquinone biosynthesis C-methylase UbiE
MTAQKQHDRLEGIMEETSRRSPMSLGERFFARIYDRMIAGTEKAGLAERRKTLISRAGGDVLEIGGGTGANLPYYGDAVTALTLTEPSEPMIRRLRSRVEAEAPSAKLLRAPAEDLPFADDSFDVAVSTLVLCGVDDQSRALHELHRVLRPGGKLLFLEHVRSREPRMARLQDRMNGINKIVARCNCNRPTLDSIQAAGFSIEQVKHGTLEKAPPFVRPLIAGVADA